MLQKIHNNLHKHMDLMAIFPILYSEFCLFKENLLEADKR